MGGASSIGGSSEGKLRCEECPNENGFLYVEKRNPEARVVVDENGRDTGLEEETLLLTEASDRAIRRWNRESFWDNLDSREQMLGRPTPEYLPEDNAPLVQLIGERHGLVRRDRFGGKSFRKQMIYCGTCRRRVNGTARKHPEPAAPEQANGAGAAIIERFEERIWGDDIAAKTARDQRARQFREAGYEVTISLVSRREPSPTADPRYTHLFTSPKVNNSVYEMIAFREESIDYVSPTKGDPEHEKILKRGRKRSEKRRSRRAL